MHKVVVPKHSGVHRFACLALYRSLLRQCSPSTSNAPWLGETRFLARQRFRRYKDLQSPSQIINALRAGYQALDLLNSASKGNRQDENQITTILAQAKSTKEKYSAMQKEISQSKPPSPPKPLSERQIQKQKSICHEKETWLRDPNAESILSRPRTKVRGKRQVPVLVNARGVPFLRIKKPQPRNLSGVIRSKLEKRWHRIELRERLQVELLFAKDEDAWDHLTKTKAEDPTLWSASVKSSLDDVCQKIKQTDQENREMSERMWQVVLDERELAAKEEKERQAAEGKSPTSG
ncbi:Complex 1 LYR protein [Penicillium sp. IBT 16267x]|nr:Complex 1 LYR protein [Penicillium sp. IBT 16267x]